MVKQAHRGFTLIEVLIALSVVFLVGVALFEGYRTAMDASARAAASVEYLGTIQQSEGRIRSELRAGITKGEIENKGEALAWEAELLENPETVWGFDPESMRVETSGQRIRLYRVTVSMPRGRSAQFQALVAEPLT